MIIEELERNSELSGKKKIIKNKPCATRQLNSRDDGSCIFEQTREQKRFFAPRIQVMLGPNASSGVQKKYMAHNHDDCWIARPRVCQQELGLEQDKDNLLSN